MEFDRACCAVYGAFMADAGCGIPEKFWMLPRVSRGRRTLKRPVFCAILTDMCEGAIEGIKVSKS